MKTKLNINTWDRKDHFNFFKDFDEPYFGVTVDIECTKAYKYCKKEKISFFLYYLYMSLKSANSIEAFKYRISNNEVFIYDTVNASPTINRPNGTFGFSYINFDENFSHFLQKATIEIERVKNTTGLIPAKSNDNVIHYSSLPWINYKSISHARNYSFKDSCPKISFGKMTDLDTKKTMPVSVYVNHALMDGLDVSKFIDEFQSLMNTH
ncbi:MAG: chloramphenicol acetyltransferase [Candidatus Marinimicrobia bacterium]|jgi:chloramphenicol O-acetyltransferase type A|nr:chloramphenicol acetyltransferase [Candidatus Neomarinimicrobiota bacterium]MBT3501247.1 chloramphenicol acetyltransferase [Candidatus Neomarinimicrobiota bacterium]MBT3839528.1 chloramphenicol acetyltransferase [Candidatus Neomarinimicrobiota bacterium]MBT3999429.1 chloramphenicol acetyltransferase [Candidatus Neomarinimicrobiota bacterium]MBT4282487.1 chloramphenicol acetyltransferase [Candidatus Neomarinimicrobiota bacterium]